MKHYKCIIGIAIIITALNAGIVMTSQFKDLKNAKAQPMTQTTYLDKDMIRMDMKADKSDIATIFRGDKELFWMVDHKKKTYTEMTKEDLEKIQKAAEQAINQMREAMKGLPKGLQDKMQSIISPGEEKKSEIIYKKVASGEKLNQWTTDKYEGTRDGKKESEVWTTDWEKLGLKSEDLARFSKMGDFFTSMIKNMSWFYKVGTDEKSEHMYIGFPIKTINFEKDKPSSQYEIQEVKQQDLAVTFFAVPKGYKKEKMNMEQE